MMAMGNMKMRWYQHSTQGVMPMTSPMKSAPSVAINATPQAAMIQNQPRFMRVAPRAFHRWGGAAVL